MDNNFSLPTLFNELAVEGTGACDTLHKNQYNAPEVIKQAKLKKTDSATMVNNGPYDTLIISCMDRSVVNLITTIHTRDAFQSGRDPRTPLKPTKGIMQGIDLSDQAMWYCLLSHRSEKWWKKIFFGLPEVTFCNTMVTYRRVNPGMWTDPDRLRLTIINKLTEGYS